MRKGQALVARANIPQFDTSINARDLCVFVGYAKDKRSATIIGGGQLLTVSVSSGLSVDEAVGMLFSPADYVFPDEEYQALYDQLIEGTFAPFKITVKG